MQRTRRHVRRTSGTLPLVAGLAATLAVVGSLCAAFVRCQGSSTSLRNSSARKCRILLRGRGGYDEAMGFGQYKLCTYAEVIRHHPNYCEYVLSQADIGWSFSDVGEPSQLGEAKAVPDGAVVWRYPSEVVEATTSINEWERDFYLNILVSPILSDRQLAKKTEIDRKIARSLLFQVRIRQLAKKTEIDRKIARSLLFQVRIKVDLDGYLRLENDALERVCKTDCQFKKEFVNETYPEILRKFIDRHVAKDENATGVGWTFVKYGHDRIGQRLVEEGLLAGARVFGGKEDPFTLPSLLNEVLTDKFYVNVDDSKAHPHYMRALTQHPEGKRVLDDFLASPGERMKDIAEHYFSDTSAESIKKAKILILALGMDGSVWSWRRDNNVSEDIPDHQFVTEYAAVMPDITQEFARLPQGKKAIELIKKEFPNKTHPERTWKSYLLQEVEFVSLKAKIAVANKYDGHGSLEHDGIKLLRGPKLNNVSVADLEAELTAAVTEAVHRHVQLNYGRRSEARPVQVPVCVKPASF
eukprot:TRINITY_DN2171_c0_g1_i3.p1 TRINITY_DN2171_c0_g1~~TRINITY_DN2171_c0_g1_i3.p1  ORF type:complete len:526 (-),score=72.07 TRINITY_DN2171_c0_g1_i3:133-1710(-)